MRDNREKNFEKFISQIQSVSCHLCIHFICLHVIKLKFLIPLNITLHWLAHICSQIFYRLLEEIFIEVIIEDLKLKLIHFQTN